MISEENDQGADTTLTKEEQSKYVADLKSALLEGYTEEQA